MPLLLRKACDDDREFLFVLYASTRQEEIAAWQWTQVQVAAFLTVQFRAQSASYAIAYPDAEHSVILEDGRPVGRLLVSRSPAEACLVDISLLPEARGRGIGSTLIRQLMTECSAAGRKLKLQVRTTNPARALYSRLGFRRVQGDSMYDQMEWPPANIEE
jgi:ribosomal protein S18 acetylase RimI-like enzyme